MGFKKYRPLKPREVEATLKRFGFEQKRQKGSHSQWGGKINGISRTVTVPQYSELTEKLLKSIFAQSGISWEEFYK